MKFAIEILMNAIQGLYILDLRWLQNMNRKNMFDRNFIASLPDDPLEAIVNLCASFGSMDREIDLQDEVSHYQDYLKAYGVILGYLEVSNTSIEIDLDLDYSTGIDNEFIAQIRKIIEEIKNLIHPFIAERITTKEKHKIIQKYSIVKGYEFSTADFQRVQILINELRDKISTSKLFDEDHRRRLLKKLEKIQSELHKKVSDLDMFWGLVGEAGVILGKFGEDSKPFVDRIREISHITWRTQATTEQLPTDSPLPQLEKINEVEGE